MRGACARPSPQPLSLPLSSCFLQVSPSRGGAPFPSPFTIFRGGGGGGGGGCRAAEVGEVRLFSLLGVRMGRRRPLGGLGGGRSVGEAEGEEGGVVATWALERGISGNARGGCGGCAPQWPVVQQCRRRRRSSVPLFAASARSPSLPLLCLFPLLPLLLVRATKLGRSKQ